jgi:hypothetical protein
MRGFANRTTCRLVAAASVVVLLFVASAPARANETVWTCINGVNNVFTHTNTYGINVAATCPGAPYGYDGLSILTAGNSVAVGQRGAWQANAPAGLVIVGAQIPPGQLLVNGINDGTQYGGGFYWAGGGAQAKDLQTQAGFAPLWTSYFGFQVVCGHSPACVTDYNDLEVADIALYVQETAGPTLTAPDGLWQTSGWIRGDWNLHFFGDSPSGLCNLSATINDASVATSSSGQDTSTWHQCSAPAVSQTIHTWQDGVGAMPLTITAWDAAGIPVSYTKTVYIDNSAPTISLSGPTDAPSTAGTQYVTATGSAGPSGVRGISCSVDNAPAQWYPGATAQVPVSGVGEHSISCASTNNAVDQSGAPAQSSSATWSLKIGDPTVSGISFGHVVNALRCKRVTERVKVPARWVTVRRHHKRVKVKRRAHVKIRKVVKCHPRTEIKRVAVRVRVRRHGKTVTVIRHKRERVVLPPHLKYSTKLRVGHGKPARVSGWLGTYAGVALGGQAVTILTAPNNGLGQFAPAATATTAADGTWTAALAAGPSRLIGAAYGGGPSTEASTSGQIVLSVPARVKLLRASPAKIPWGGTVHLVGQLVGGYLPPGGALVRLRIGEGSAQTTYGVREHVSGTGRFTAAYTFGQGVASIHRTYWFQLASLPTGNYPYAPASSRRLSVRVGGHPKNDVGAHRSCVCDG